VLAGVLGAPFTAAIFALGLTGDFNALLPLLLTSGVAYGFTVLVMRRSIMTEKIARRGFHIYREYGVDPMERTHASDIMSSELVMIDRLTSLEEVGRRHFGAGQTFRSYPVVDEAGRFVGIVDREALQRLRELHPPQTPVGAVVAHSALAVLPGQTCRVVATQLAVHGVERIAVIDNPERRRLVGLISRSDLIKTSLHFFEQEHRREKLIHWARPPEKIAAWDDA